MDIFAHRQNERDTHTNLIFTAHVRSTREGNVFIGVCPSVSGPTSEGRGTSCTGPVRGLGDALTRDDLAGGGGEDNATGQGTPYCLPPSCLDQT